MLSRRRKGKRTSTLFGIKGHQKKKQRRGGREIKISLNCKLLSGICLRGRAKRERINGSMDKGTPLLSSDIRLRR